jgi:hypothetical protein
MIYLTFHILQSTWHYLHVNMAALYFVSLDGVSMSSALGISA